MAVYGIGAAYGGRNDKTKDFLHNNCACIGWGEQDAPSLYKLLSKIKISDFIYIKSMSISTKELLIKAVGIVEDDTIETKSTLGKGIRVKWLWHGIERVPLTEKMYKYNVYNNTLYEEYLSDVQKKVINLAIQGVQESYIR
ncbi:hypothetical protein [Priestia aryabhattai]|uniref:hypothetical protein n=1 Tax=Priestia aryabhattai TaxID=412384 RepID=UPI003D27934A